MKVPEWLSRLALQVVLGLCVLFILNTIWSIYIGYTTYDSPLIPKVLGNYIAFPNVVFAVIYASIGYIAYKLLVIKDFSIRCIYPLAFLILVEIGKFYIYALLHEVNPFG